MKTRILLILLMVSSFAFAQTWNQVGATQFTNFADSAEIAFNTTTGQPYVVSHNPINDEVVVETFDGTNWVAVGAVISTQGHNNLAIKVNPVTQEPWVALKRNGSGSGSTIDIFRYDGASWVGEGSNILLLSGLYSYGIQLQFNASGNARIAGVRGSGSNRKAVFATYNTAATWNVIDGRVEPNLRLDLCDYDNYFYSEHYGRFASFQGYIRKHTVINNSNADEFVLGYYPSRTLDISGIAGTNYFVSNDIVAYNGSVSGTNPDIIFGDGDTSDVQPQPLNTLDNTNNILKFRKSNSDNNLYLMFSDASENLVFQKYSVGGQTWSVLPSIGLVTSTANFFTSMAMNPVNGDMYVTYLDGGRVSVKRFSIEPPLTKYYVNANVSGGDASGDSWVNAMPSLADALNVAGSVTTDVWVTAGTYKPSASVRSASFNLGVDNLQVIGGFNGTETTLAQRNIGNNPTILSGDLNGDDAGIDFATATRADNSYHVVEINGNDIVLDGFIIQDGHANGGNGNNAASAISKLETANALNLKNCTIKNNVSLVAGSIQAWFDTNGTINMENCIFDGNISTYASGVYGGTRNNRTLTVNITNSLFANNVSKNNGGTLGFTGSSVWLRANGSGSTITTTIVNSTFVNNIDIGTQSALVNKGTLSLARASGTHNATISNSIFYDNENASGVTSLAVTQGHTTAVNLVAVNNSIDEANFSNLTYLTNTSNANPMFTSTTDFTLITGSPAIDTGDNSKIPAGINVDLFGNDRIFNTTVDMGAYEFGSTLDVDNFEAEINEFKIYPNPVSNTLNIKMSQDFNKAQVYNIQGQKVLESNTKTINVSNLAAGLYLIQIEDTNGATQTKRFIKN
ncbi:T9SS type A sorting domain-containing protein [Lacinutrix jangbogonensis]|uniref:T9SS type A sorting domain-containing protein n=1 Tax=Lacinutrix jangbogonensis TaxID=1469557 RepID=UPI00053D215F|nr:T9SS type A sorting domain-containing protein [Lacinutrix jangbogonensis]